MLMDSEVFPSILFQLVFKWRSWLVATIKYFPNSDQKEIEKVPTQRKEIPEIEERTIWTELSTALHKICKKYFELFTYIGKL